MLSLEQVRLLESKVTRAIDYVKIVTDENKTLKGKLDSYQKRIDELEVLILQFKEEQGRIEDGILSALDRLNQFEDALERTLTTGSEAPPPVEQTLESEASSASDKTLAKTTVAPKKEAPVKKEPEAPDTAEESALQPEPKQNEDSRLSNEELDIF